VALSGCREGEIARRLRVGDRVGARAVAERYARLFAARRPRLDSPATAAFFLELQHHLLPDDDWLVSETAALAGELGLPVVVTNDVHYAYPEGREMQDVPDGDPPRPHSRRVARSAAAGRRVVSQIGRGVDGDAPRGVAATGRVVAAPR